MRYDKHTAAQRQAPEGLDPAHVRRRRRSQLALVSGYLAEMRSAAGWGTPAGVRSRA